jgi:hypothetical protein
MERKSRNRWTLGALVDLHWQLRADQHRQELGAGRLIERDRRIAARLTPTASQSALYRQWLEHVRSEHTAPTPGQTIDRIHATLRSLLLAIAIFVGFALVWGWLVTDQTRPANAIHFFAVVIGLPLLLWLGWLLTALYLATRRELPTAPPLGRLNVLALYWLIARLGLFAARRMQEETVDPRETRQLIHDLLQKHRPIWFWAAGELTQLFALAFAVGAVLALAIAFYLTDPVFGWRSALLDSNQLAAITRLIDWPWRGWHEMSVVDVRAAERTHFSALAPRYGGQAAGQVAATAHPWFGFMLLSLLFYALIPRLITYLLASWRLQRLLHHAPLAEPGLLSVRERLQAAIRTGATTLDPTDHADELTPGRLGKLDEVAITGSLLLWEGTTLSAQDAKTLLSRRGLEVLSVHPVGGLDVRDDEEAVEAAARQALAEVVWLLAPAWSAPTEEYFQLLRSLRASLTTAGREQYPVRVLLYEQEENGAPAPPDAEDARQWRLAIGRLNDPHTDVTALMEPA